MEVLAGSRNVLPCCAIDGGTGRLLVNAKSASDVGDQHPAGTERSHFPYGLFCEFCSSVLFASCVWFFFCGLTPALGVHVGDVVSLRASEQMGRINTKAVVATVADLQSVNSLRRVCNQVSVPVGVDASGIANAYSKSTVAIRHHESSPEPALAKFFAMCRNRTRLSDQLPEPIVAIRFAAGDIARMRAKASWPGGCVKSREPDPAVLTNGCFHAQSIYELQAEVKVLS
jgi:hypothetical protein